MGSPLEFVFCFFWGGCQACAWTKTAPGVLGRGRPRVLGRRMNDRVKITKHSPTPSSYHPKGGLIGTYMYLFIYLCVCMSECMCLYICIDLYTFWVHIYIRVLRSLRRHSKRPHVDATCCCWSCLLVVNCFLFLSNAVLSPGSNDECGRGNTGGEAGLSDTDGNSTFFDWWCLQHLHPHSQPRQRCPQLRLR